MVRMAALCPTSGPNSAASGTDTCSGVVGVNSRRVSPQRRRVGFVRKISPTRVSPRNVPLREPRSRTRTPRSVATSSMWTALTFRSSRTRLQASLRPTTFVSGPISIWMMGAGGRASLVRPAPFAGASPGSAATRSVPPRTSNRPLATTVDSTSCAISHAPRDGPVLPKRARARSSRYMVVGLASCSVSPSTAAETAALV